ncbi:MAG: dTDP-glucose 4,6-dehydratase [Candidatus Spechtbacteria bacterium]|nr:dTDP-glucose 4,6-dehydratase [Candidatus Spechtbacteria bacterium]
MKLLITGGAGFIGSNFIHYWHEKYPADSIVNIDKLTYAGNLNNLKGVAEEKNYRFVRSDICDQNETLDKAIKNCDVIVHFAAETHVDRSLNSADEFLRTNIFGTYNLLCYAKKYNKRFHHISTDEVFGSLDLESKEKFNEQTPYSPRNPYSASKASSDHIVQSFFHTHQLPITISNCSNNFGPYQNSEKFIPKAITNLINGQKVPVYGRGVNVRDWLHVEDHCRAIDLIIQKGRIGETYCVGGLTEDISNIDVIKIVLEEMNLKDDMIEFVTDRPGHDLKYAVDWTKINRELGYQPTFDFSTHLKTTIQWYLNNQWWWQN